jgi:hypothetical protein
MTYVVGTPGPGLRQTNKMFVLRGDQVNGSKILSYRRITLSIVKYLVNTYILLLLCIRPYNDKMFE